MTRKIPTTVEISNGKTAKVGDVICLYVQGFWAMKKITKILSEKHIMCVYEGKYGSMGAASKHPVKIPAVRAYKTKPEAIRCNPSVSFYIECAPSRNAKDQLLAEQAKVEKKKAA